MKVEKICASDVKYDVLSLIANATTAIPHEVLFSGDLIEEPVVGRTLRSPKPINSRD